MNVSVKQNRKKKVGFFFNLSMLFMCCLSLKGFIKICEILVAAVIKHDCQNALKNMLKSNLGY